METAPTELYTYCHTLSLPDALPISCARSRATPNPSSEEEGFDSIISTFALIPAIGARHGRQIRLSDRRDRRRRAHGRDRHAARRDSHAGGQERKSVVSGQSVSDRDAFGGRRTLNKNRTDKQQNTTNNMQ